jgi:polyisoprenoid-binding protein YceI
MKARYLIGLIALALTAAIGGWSVHMLARANQKPAVPAYEVDTQSSRVYVKVDTATRFGHPHGVQGNLKSGKVTFGRDGELVFDMGSFQADTAEARQRVGLDPRKGTSDARKVTEAMLGGGVLDVGQFPTATFRMTSVAPLDNQAAGEPGRYQLDGRFTLHGTEQRIQIAAKVDKTATEGVLRLSGSFTIKQTDYGITPYSALGGLAKVADELVIWADLVLKPEGAR